MKRYSEKTNILTELLKNGNNRITVKDLINAAGSERAARSVLWIARHDSGIKLQAVREGGRKVVAYIHLNQTLPESPPESTTKPEPVKSPSKRFQDVML